jgi:hypothetical protein
VILGLLGLFAWRVEATQERIARERELRHVRVVAVCWAFRIWGCRHVQCVRMVGTSQATSTTRTRK